MLAYVSADSMPFPADGIRIWFCWLPLTVTRHCSAQIIYAHERGLYKWGKNNSGLRPLRSTVTAAKTSTVHWSRLSTPLRPTSSTRPHRALLSLFHSELPRHSSSTLLRWPTRLIPTKSSKQPASLQDWSDSQSASRILKTSSRISDRLSSRSSTNTTHSLNTQAQVTYNLSLYFVLKLLRAICQYAFDIRLCAFDKQPHAFGTQLHAGD